MKVVIVKEENKVAVNDIPLPSISEGDVLVKMKACGLCGSDLEKVYGHYGMVSKRLGHEPAGEIESVGKNVKNFKVGDRVFVHHHVPCYSCHYCMHGDHTLCPYYQKSNIDPCGLAESFLVPEWNVKRGGIIKLPSKVSFEEAAMIEPLASCIRAISKANVAVNDDVVIIGVGPVGIMHIMLAKLFGANRVFALDINDFRLDFARKIGIELTFNMNEKYHSRIRDATNGRGADLVIVATGNKEAFLNSLELTRSGGKIILFGVPPKGSNVELDINRIFSKEIKIIPSYASTEKETRYALRLIKNGSVDIKSIITHRFSLDRASEAFRCAFEGKNTMKVVVTA